MAPETETIAEAAASVEDAANARVEEQVERAVEHAQEEIERAEETAEAIAAAAMESERGRRLEILEGEIATWRARTEALENSLKETQATLANLIAAAAAPPTVVVATPAPQSNGSIPPASPVEAVTVETINPAEASGAAGAGQEAAETVHAVRKKARFL